MGGAESEHRDCFLGFFSCRRINRMAMVSSCRAGSCRLLFIYCTLGSWIFEAVVLRSVDSKDVSRQNIPTAGEDKITGSHVYKTTHPYMTA